MNKMKVKLTRLSNTHVRLSMSMGDTKVRSIEVPHTLGYLNQANLFIAEQCILWQADVCEIFTDDPDEITMHMWRKAKEVMPLRIPWVVTVNELEQTH